MLTRIARRQNLSEVVTDRIVSQVLSGGLKPGHRLPTEPELCLALGVGRNTLREGLRPLVVLGLIEVRPGEGAFVSEDTMSFFAKPLSWGLLIDEEQIPQLIEARNMIELSSIHLAIQRRSEDSMAKLAALVKDMEAHQGEIETYLDIDMRFHAEIAEMSNNQVLSRQVLTMCGLIRPWLSKVAYVEGYTKDSLSYHRRLFEALRRRDEPEAAQALSEHIRSLHKRVDSQHALPAATN